MLPPRCSIHRAGASIWRPGQLTLCGIPFVPLSLSDVQVRRARPARELTCDEVNRGLSRQEALLGSLLQKLQRGAGLVCVDSGKLQEVKQKLTATLKDKVRCCPGGPCAVAIAEGHLVRLLHQAVNHLSKCYTTFHPPNVEGHPILSRQRRQYVA